MALGEGASGVTHIASAIIIGKQGIDLRDQIIGIADRTCCAAGDCFGSL